MVLSKLVLISKRLSRSESLSWLKKNKEEQKGKIFPFVVGILVGAIITTCCFLIYTKTHKKEENNPRFNQEQMKDGRGFKGGEKPNGEPESMNNEGGNTERKSK